MLSFEKFKGDYTLGLVYFSKYFLKIVHKASAHLLAVKVYNSNFLQ